VNFTESESYLLSLGNEVSAMKLGLENIRRLLAALGDPQKNYLKVQVAGTNGKGSVCAFLDAICIEAGIATGVFTSPHLVSITERVRLNGQDISEADFARYATRVRETVEHLLTTGEIENVATFFEQVTAIALIAFAEENVKLAILETGLGGRLDATTAANAEIAAITRIDLDHQEYLGETLAEIAAEKAAIVRPDSKVIIAHQSREVERVISGRCREVGIDPIWATADIITTNYDEDAPYRIRSTSFRTKRRNYNGNVLGLLGKHQIQNASVAIALVEILLAEGLAISDDDIWLGLETAKHPGRLEYGGRYLFDGAHNAAGAKALCEYLDEFVDKPLTLIFAAMKGKEIGRIAEILFENADRLILTRCENSRSMTADEIVPFVPNTIDHARIIVTDNVEQALAKADEVSSADDLVLVTGSLYLVGEVKKILNN